MKKYFYLAAVSAMMLTACSSDKDVLQPTPEPTQQVAVQQKAVAFDTYLSGTTASTRAGDPLGVMTTEKLKTADKGFGVFAMYTGTSPYATGTFSSNFMFNEHVSWNGGWTYSPLKYWPNETAKDAANSDFDADSQSDPAEAPHLEKLSFFAYAPYVNLSTPGDLLAASDGLAYEEATPTSGILAISKETYKNDPMVKWSVGMNAGGTKVDLDNNVDLLWGVAPNGMDYTAVNGENVPTTFGMPLLNLVKPDKDQKIKFLFQHALSRMSLSVVSAIDQIAAGDDAGKFDPDQTRVLIDNVSIWGTFSDKGVLNLNNTKKNEANWVQASIHKSGSDEVTPLITLDQGTSATENGYIAPDLRYVASQIAGVTGTDSNSDGIYDTGGDAAAFANLNRGVLPSETVLLSGDADPDPNKYTTTKPSYQYGKVYYVSNGDAAGKSYVTAKAVTPAATNVYSKDKDGNYTLVSTGGYKVDGTTPYYTLSGDATALTGTIAASTTYWLKSGNTYTKKTAAAAFSATGAEYNLTSEAAVTATYENAAGWWSALIPRYFMFVPSKTSDPTDIYVKIAYHVVTKDTKLNGYVSDVVNIITKKISLQMESGKSYNLRLILGLTSVKLDAVVGEWLVGDDAEVWLPQNVE